MNSARQTATIWLCVTFLGLLAALPLQAQRNDVNEAIKAAIRRKLPGDTIFAGLREVRDSVALYRDHVLCTGTGLNKWCHLKDGKPFFTIEQIEVYPGDSAYANVAHWFQVDGPDARIARFFEVWTLRLVKGKWIATKTDEVGAAN